MANHEPSHESLIERPKMPKRSTYDSITKNDERALRLLGLATMLQESPKPVASTDIARALYPDATDRTFRKQFLRDREALEELGLVLAELPLEDGFKAWSIDRDRSFVPDAGLSSDEARALYVFCHDLTTDPGFAWGDELRVALSKIAQIYRGSTLASPDVARASNRRLLCVLLPCLSEQRMVEVDYIDAKGQASTRTLALLGTFGLQDRTYFVAHRKGAEQLAPHTYRLDRIQEARPCGEAGAYQIPEDFDAHDYLRLPFQLGLCEHRARILVGDKPLSDELATAISRSGQVTEGVWEVPYHHAEELASWTVALGIVPLDPDELTCARKELLAKSAGHLPLDLALDEQMAGVKAHGADARPRPDSRTLARQLMVLLSSLTDEGDVITAEQIATSLDIDYAQARHLIMLLGMSSGESLQYLPVVPDEDDLQVYLMQGACLHPRRVRLNATESHSVIAALAELGFDQDDKLVRTVTQTYLGGQWRQPALAEDHAPQSDELREALQLCSQAIDKECQLGFAYPSAGTGVRLERVVSPKAIRHREGIWYLDAFDHLRAQDRTFRIERMESLRLCLDKPPVPRTPQHAQRQVLVCFHDVRYLEFFSWEGLEVLARTEKGVICRLPHYGGSWLTRRLAACAGTVTTSDQDLAEQVLAYAQTLLAN
jgi:proteasome accessory factor C